MDKKEQIDRDAAIALLVQSQERHVMMLEKIIESQQLTIVQLIASNDQLSQRLRQQQPDW